MRALFNHVNETSELLPGAGWVEAVNVAREAHLKSHRLDPNSWSNSELRALGSALGGCYIQLSTDGVSEIIPVELDLDDFAQAAQPPLDATEMRDLSHGFRTVTSDDMRGVEV